MVDAHTSWLASLRVGDWVRAAFNDDEIGYPKRVIRVNKKTIVVANRHCDRTKNTDDSQTTYDRETGYQRRRGGGDTVKGRWVPILDARRLFPLDKEHINMMIDRGKRRRLITRIRYTSLEMLTTDTLSKIVTTINDGKPEEP